jgi:glycosyltransferase involved in cell wall biosynthesis
MDTSFSVAVFAYNEAALIGACLDSILGEGDAGNLVIHVLINGCTDRTEEVVKAYAARHSHVFPVSILLGDKANAWNHYVHDIAPEADFHCFIDGDMTIVRRSLAGLAQCFAEHPEATAAAGLPVSGRNRDAFRQKLIRNRELAGNFYALRGRAIDTLRTRLVRLPIGIFGEDGLVTTLIKWDIDPLGPCHETRVVPCPDAGFRFDSLSLFRPGDWRTYRNRKMRYAVRRQQANILYPLLFTKGVSELPDHALDLYRARRSEFRLEWNGWDTVFDYLAIRRIRKQLTSKSETVLTGDARHYS